MWLIADCGAKVETKLYESCNSFNYIHVVDNLLCRVVFIQYILCNVLSDYVVY